MPDQLHSGFCSNDEERAVASLGVVIYKVCLFGDTILTNGASVFIMLLNKHLLLSAVCVFFFKFFIKDDQ